MIQSYFLRKWDWGMMTRGCLVPSQTVFGSGMMFVLPLSIVQSLPSTE